MTEVVLDRIHVAFTIMYSLPVSAAHGLTRYASVCCGGLSGCPRGDLLCRRLSHVPRQDHGYER